MKKIISVFSALILATAAIFAQNQKVTGTVLDSGTGEPVPSVAVQLKGTSTYAMTNDLGEFSIEAPSAGSLVISCLGYHTAEVAINGLSELKVLLEQDKNILEDAIVVAYGTVSREANTGSVSTFKSEQLAQVPVTSVDKMLSGKMVSVSPFIDDLYNGISGNSSVKDLETAFQLLYLEFMEPRFDQEEFDNAIAQIKAVLPNLVNTPNFAFQKRFNKVLYNDNPRNEVLSMEKLEKVNLQTIEKNYRRLFADAAGAVMVIVGDVNLDTLKPLVEKYIGSLPKGKKAAKWADVQPQLVKGKVVDVFDQKMETPLTTVLQVYSDYRPFTVKEQTLASAVSYILDQIYTDTLREDEGGTYGASTVANARKDPNGRYLLQVYFNCKPALAEKLRALAQDGFRKLAEEGPTDEQFTRTVEHFKKNVPESRINNSYWLSDLLRYFRGGYDYDKEWEAAVGGLTKESIRDAAARLYNSGNFVEVVMMPGETTEAE